MDNQLIKNVVKHFIINNFQKIQIFIPKVKLNN